jgi:hypothetical protein
MNNFRGRKLTTAVLALGLTVACAGKDDLHVQLEARRPLLNDIHRLEVQAQVQGPQEGLRYKWFSVQGEFDPQESYLPRSAFTFASNSSRDRIWVEVWRENDRLAQSVLDVIPDPGVAPPTKAPAIQVAITQVPPYQPGGGSDTRANISGTVSGEITPDSRVVIYARADAWYVQPMPYTTLEISADKTWKSWTHTGGAYAALVVARDYKPFMRLDVLPQVGGEILARTFVEGRRSAQ